MQNEWKKVSRLMLGVILTLGTIIGVLTLTGTHETVRKYLAGIFIVLIAMFGSIGSMDSNLSSGPEMSDGLVEVTRVIDGDTIIISGDRKVRLLGINAPESGDCFFEESRDALAELIDGEKVDLKKDVSGMDNFGRLLRYVFLPSGSEYTDDMFVNQRLLREGYADIGSASQDRVYRSLLVSARNQAVTERNGMWGVCEDRGDTAETEYPLEGNDQPQDSDCTIKGNISRLNLGKTYFFVGCSNYDKVKIDFSKGEQYFCTEEEAMEAGFVKSGSCR